MISWYELIQYTYESICLIHMFISYCYFMILLIHILISYNSINQFIHINNSYALFII